MGHRRKAREYALQALYMYETVKSSQDELCSMEWTDKELPDDIKNFAVAMIDGSIEKIEYIDKLIDKHSRNWKFERLSTVDKSILRISIYTLLFHPDIPVAVTINEGVELGKTFGGEGSGQFINGVLDAIKKSERKRGDSKTVEKNKEK